MPRVKSVDLDLDKVKSAARSTCVQRALLVSRRQHGVQVQEQLCRRALHARAGGLGDESVVPVLGQGTAVFSLNG